MLVPAKGASGRGRQARVIYSYLKIIRSVHESIVLNISTVPTIGTLDMSYVEGSRGTDKILPLVSERLDEEVHCHHMLDGVQAL